MDMMVQKISSPYGHSIEFRKNGKWLFEKVLMNFWEADRAWKTIVVADDFYRKNGYQMIRWIEIIKDTKYDQATFLRRNTPAP